MPEGVGQEGTESPVVPVVPSDPLVGTYGAVTQALTLAASWIVLFVFIKPSLLLSRTLATGGDMGSHHYISKAARSFFPWSLGGWATGWFAGLPMLEFYFPTPYLLIWGLEHVVGYEIAFKLVTVAGTFGLPLAAWLLFTLLEAPPAARALAPLGAVTFLFVQGHGGYEQTQILDIFGGFITSTMAGEFAYSLGLTLAIVCIGMLYRTTRRADPAEGDPPIPWGWVAVTALVIGITATTHMIPVMLLVVTAPALFVATPSDRRGAIVATVATVVGAGLFVIIWRRVGFGTTDTAVRSGWQWMFGGGVAVVGAVICVGLASWRRVLVVVAAGGLGAGLAAFWLLPATTQRIFTAEGVWVNEYSAKWLFPDWLWLPALGLLGAVIIGVLRGRAGALLLGWMALAGFALFFLFPEGQVVNGRFLPFVYLAYCLGAAWFAGELIDLIRWPLGWQPVRLVAVCVAGAALLTVTVAQGYEKASGWPSYNYKGFEAQAAYPEYMALMQAIQDLPDGRVAWEYNNDYSRFGTPRALENIPYFTDKDTMEGLLVESGISAPFTFFMQNEYSSPGTGAVPGIQMPSFDPAGALVNLRRYGVRWFVAETDTVRDGFLALSDDGVREFTTSGKFTIFEIDDSPMVSVLTNEPVYMNPETATCRRVAGDSANKPCDWQLLSLQWMRTPDVQDVAVTFGDGRGGAGPPLQDLQQVSSVDALSDLERVPVPEASPPSDISVERTEIRFHTEAIGAPHLVAVSYFPNWKAEGADGPYLVTPSLMLVFPRQQDVRLVYAPSDIERVGQAVSLLALLAVIAAAFFSPTLRRRRRHRSGGSVAAGAEAETAQTPTPPPADGVGPPPTFPDPHGAEVTPPRPDST